MKLTLKLFSSLIIIMFYQLSDKCYAQNNSIVLDGAYIVLDGGTTTNKIFVVVDQPDPSGIVRLPAGGHIHSENQFNLVKWNSESTTGNYIFPFGVNGNATDYIPFTFNKTAGDNSISASTWATNNQNTPYPEASNVAEVTSMTGITDSVEYAIDRFWDIQAESTTADLTFSYRGSENTTSLPNSSVQAQHWNGNSWDAPVGPGSPGVTNGIGTVGPVLAQTSFSPWVLIAPCLTDSLTQNLEICQGSSITVGNNTYNSTGIYIDNFTNNLGCDSILTTNLTVTSLPIVNSTFSNDACAANQGEITITSSSPNTPLSYSWNTGSTNSNLTGLSEGNYTVTVTDSKSCSVSETIYISNTENNCDCFVYVANAFSPNGDNNNDFIPVRGECVQSLSFRIFNRWGNLVFETNQLDKGWDGYYKGKLQNSGIFIYTLDATFTNGKNVTESGDITLIR